MSSKKIITALKGVTSPEIIDAASAISEIKGENIDALLSKFLTDYVHENLNVLTEKAKLSIPSKEE